jgi:hypothetical protein
VWQELSGIIDNMLDNVTLADVIATEKERKPRARGTGAKSCGRSSGGRRRKVDKR